MVADRIATTSGSVTSHPSSWARLWDDVTTRVGALLPIPEDLAAMARSPRRDLLAGLTVAIVALPLALAFGVASGMGAQAGLATAVVAGILAAVFGGSNLQVSGPTGAMTVVLVPIVHRFGPSGVLMVGSVAGLILIAMALMRLGRYVRFLPVSLIEGFTAGIAVVIALQQVPAALGVENPTGEKVWAQAAHAARSFLTSPHPAPVLVAGCVTLLMVVGARWRPGIPFSLIGVVVATVAAALLPLPLVLLGPLPAGLPRPSLSFVDLASVQPLLSAALAIAALAALESLLCATVADAMSVDGHHDPDRELFGQGVANLVTPVFGGVPATAAIARTAVNVRAGATSRLAAVTHAVIILGVVFFAAPLVSKIPLAALAGVLFATCIRMVEVASLRALLRSTRTDAAIVVLTFVVTVAVDLVTAVGVGLAAAVVLALRSVARNAGIEEVPLERADHTADEHALLSQHIVAYRLDGPLFFAAAHQGLLELADITDVRVVILRMSRVSALDATGAQLLDDVIFKLEHRSITVMLSGVTDPHQRILTTLGVATKLRTEGLVFGDTPTAIQHSRSLLGLTGHDGSVTSHQTPQPADPNPVKESS